MLQSKEQIGKLDRRITFQEKIIGEDVSNDDVETGWQDIETSPEVWAKVEEKTGTEEFKADNLKDVLITHFTIRYRSDLDARMRIVYNNRPYNIQGFPEINRKGYMKILAHTGMTGYQETVT